jgi:hypothetical protein
VSAAVIRQQMGHASADMTALYTGEIPTEQVLKQSDWIQMEQPTRHEAVIK